MATDLEIATQRLRRIRDLLRKDARENDFLHDGISASRFKQNLRDIKNELQEEIAVVEQILSVNPVTVEQTDIP